MSYRLAELLKEAEHDPDARDSAADLTLRLWNHRSDWPNGWPPEEVKRQIPWLFDSDWTTRGGGNATETDRFMQRIAESLTEEYQFWLRAVGATVESDESEAFAPWESGRAADVINKLRKVMAGAADTSANDESSTREDQMASQLEAMLAQRRSLLATAFALGADDDESDTLHAQG
jgi:hypothetical protein